MKHRSRARKAGLPPGTPVHIGDRQVEKVQLSLIEYSPVSLRKEILERASQATFRAEPASMIWLDVIGLHNTKLLEEVGALFGIHPLILEDIANTDHRPKMETFDDYIFIVAKMLRPTGSGPVQIDAEQVSFVFGKGFLITFQEKPGDVFDPVRERLKAENSRMRKGAADYLVYALLDNIVDNYFGVLDKVSEEIETLEDAALSGSDFQVSRRIHQLKRTLIFIRRAVWPLRETIANMLRDAPELIRPETRPFLRDLYDHTVHIADTMEIYRDILSGVLEVHLSSVNFRMGQVMKVLTVIATIFIPLTFVAGIYGMNFEYMPELAWKWSYPVILLVMLSIGLGFFAFFRIRRWI